MKELTQGNEGALLSRSKKAVYGILAPLIVGVVGFWVILGTANGEGPSVGGRGMVLTLVLFPAALVAAGVLNTCVLILSLRRRFSAFLLGTVVPVIGLILAYAYLWRIGPFQH